MKAKIELLRSVFPLVSYQSNRTFSVSSINLSIKNFARFTLLYRGTEYEKKKQKECPDRTEIGWSHGVRHPGYWINNRFVLIPELIPDIIVPDLTDCEFKPYVSYRTNVIPTSEFKPQDLFDEVYTPKIEHDFKENKLDEEGNSTEPSEAEKLTSTIAYNKARMSGSDYFAQDRPNMTIYDHFHIK